LAKDLASSALALKESGNRGVSSTVKLSVSKTELGGSNPSAPAKVLRDEKVRSVMGVGTKKMGNSIVAAGDSFGDRIKSWPERAKTFYNDVRTEMKKVTAPSFKEVRATTAVVIVTVFLFAAYFWAVDLVIGHGIDSVFRYFGHH
jgi:preprotein translocase subunit SecE